jgi:predicted O-methyltransferase YrrM
MPIIDKLISAYRVEGIDICTGLASHDFGNLPSAPFTRFVKDGRSMTGGLGIALQEIYLLENLFGAYRPRHVLIIGNSLGWSTLAIAMLLPDSQIAAMDAGFDENALCGLDLTNRMAASAGLNKVRALKGASPQAVAGVVDAELDGRVDFALIDGLHTNEQVVLDYEAIARKAARDAVYLFHDVYAFNLHEGIAQIEQMAGRAVQSLRATPSGMAILYDPEQHLGMIEALAAFAPSPNVLEVVKDEVRHYSNYLRLKRRLRRNPPFMKGVNALRRLGGAKPYGLPPDD